MDHGYLPIILRYEGLDADSHVIDLGQLGQSIQGAARLLGSAGTIVETGHFAKKSASLSVRVLAGQPQAHCYEFVAILATISPAAIPMLPVIQDAAQKAATKAVTGIVNYAIARLGGNKSEAEAIRDVANKALEEMGHTSRTALDAMERVASTQRPAIKLLVAPVGQSCTFARVGRVEDGAIAIDKPMRDAIEAPEELEIGNATRYEILLSELDLKNKSCKFSLRDEEDVDMRYNGEITDPILQTPNNPYSTALNSQRWLKILAKPQTKEGELERLYISDIGPSD